MLDMMNGYLIFNIGVFIKDFYSMHTMNDRNDQSLTKKSIGYYSHFLKKNPGMTEL